MPISYAQARFEAAFGLVSQLPASSTPEVSFCGRSNVGKSSLLNCLLGRKNLARVSSQPGKTANINFFLVDGIRFVDLPGYGFAKVSKTERQRWADLIGGYFEQDRSFNLVICLVDLRIPAQDLDIQMINFVKEQHIPYIVAFTKADKLTRNKQQAQKALLQKALDVDAEHVIVTSSSDKTGIAELKRRIEGACLT